MSGPFELHRVPSYVPQRDDVLLFETAWEVAKRVGGIYTVLKSKAEITMAEVSSECLRLAVQNRRKDIVHP